mgnify:CR=1 FL=1
MRRSQRSSSSWSLAQLFVFYYRWTDEEKLVRASYHRGSPGSVLRLSVICKSARWKETSKMKSTAQAQIQIVRHWFRCSSHIGFHQSTTSSSNSLFVDGSRTQSTASYKDCVEKLKEHTMMLLSCLYHSSLSKLTRFGRIGERMEAASNSKQQPVDASAHCICFW